MQEQDDIVLHLPLEHVQIIINSMLELPGKVCLPIVQTLMAQAAAQAPRPAGLGQPGAASAASGAFDHAAA